MYLLQSVAFLTSVVYGFSSTTSSLMVASPDYHHHLIGTPHQSTTNAVTTILCPSRTTRIHKQYSSLFATTSKQKNFLSIHSNTMMKATHQQQQQQQKSSLSFRRKNSFVPLHTLVSRIRSCFPTQLVRSNHLTHNTNLYETVLAFHRGGGVGSATTTTKSNSDTELQLSSTFNTGTKCPMTGTATILASLWGTGGVLYILGKAVKRVLPIALEPFQTVSNGLVPLTTWQLR